jgi:hypothetical protein
MVRISKALAVAGLSFALALSTGGGSIARAQGKKSNEKNTMRAAGIALGALAAHQALKGKTTNALILGAGAAYAGKRYEDARKAESRDRDGSWRQSRRDGDRDEDRRRGEGDRYDGSDRYDGGDRYDEREDSPWDRRRDDARDDRDRYDYDGRYDYDDRDGGRDRSWGRTNGRETLSNMGRRRDNGLHLGHYKNGKAARGAAYAKKHKPGR